MGEGVAIVQRGPQPGRLALVLLDHPGFEGRRPFDGMADRRGFTGQDGCGVILEPGEELGVEDHAVFHHLGQSADELAVGQGGEGVDIGNHASRLPERPNQVFPGGQVDARFPANRAVDLSDERGRHLPHE